ncbi:hypothetical protein, partial [Burkholderia ambifaria]|uniref:hypothetical protein n=1 Tax=Burkholderia ambifaria TaxID=152480 RepID=UPI002446255F
EIELFADERPVDVELESEVTALLVELSPVDNELMPVEVEVDSEATELLVELRPVEVEVESDEIELFADERPV